MKTTWKILLGVVSLVPIVFFAFFFFWLIPAFFAPRAEGSPSLYSQRFDSLVPAAIATSVMVMLLLLLYALLLYRRADLDFGEKVGVPFAIFFTNGLVLPVVWWLYIWRESDLQALSRRREHG